MPAWNTTDRSFFSHQVSTLTGCISLGYSALQAQYPQDLNVAKPWTVIHAETGPGALSQVACQCTGTSGVFGTSGDAR